MTEVGKCSTLGLWTEMCLGDTGTTERDGICAF